MKFGKNGNSTRNDKVFRNYWRRLFFNYSFFNLFNVSPSHLCEIFEFCCIFETLSFFFNLHPEVFLNTQ